MWNLQDLLEYCKTNSVQIDGKYVPSRPENFKKEYCSLYKRILFAWEVIRGRAETFKWPNEQ